MITRIQGITFALKSCSIAIFTRMSITILHMLLLRYDDSMRKYGDHMRVCVPFCTGKRWICFACTWRYAIRWRRFCFMYGCRSFPRWVSPLCSFLIGWSITSELYAFVFLRRVTTRLRLSECIYMYIELSTPISTLKNMLCLLSIRTDI